MARSQNDPQAKILSVDGTFIGYSVFGRGIPLVVCPVPWGVQAHVWSAVLRLAEHFMLVFIDPRGVGSSGPVRDRHEYSIATLIRDIDAVRQHLGIPQWSLLGQSAGGFTALEYALAFPRAVEKLVIVCSSPTGFFHRGTIRDKHHPRYGEIKDAAERFRREFTAERFREYLCAVYAMDVHTDAGRAEIESVFGNADISIERYKYFATVELNRYDVTVRLESIACPSLILSGAHDIHVSPSYSEMMAGKIPHAAYINFDKSGHFPWLDEPDRFVHCVSDFLQRRRVD